MGLFGIWFWLTIGAFAAQALGRHDWDEAFGCAFYQAVAISAVWFSAKVRALSVPSEERS